VKLIEFYLRVLVAPSYRSFGELPIELFNLSEWSFKVVLWVRRRLIYNVIW
jgi:hypothetical protein